MASRAPDDEAKSVSGSDSPDRFADTLCGRIPLPRRGILAPVHG